MHKTKEKSFMKITVQTLKKARPRLFKGWMSLSDLSGARFLVHAEMMRVGRSISVWSLMAL